MPGNMSLDNMMPAHGLGAHGFDKAETGKVENIMAFMFETRSPQLPTRYGAELETQQHDFVDLWSGLKKRFDGMAEGDWS